MRGAYYVITALLIAASSRTAADFDQARHSQPSDGDKAAPGSTATGRVLDQGSHELDDNLALSSDDEERVLEGETLDLIGALETPLLKTLTESVEANFAKPKALQESASNWHNPAYSGFSAPIDAFVSRNGEDSLAVNTALELSDMTSQNRQLPAPPGTDVAARKMQRLDVGSSAANYALTPPQTIKEHMRQPLDDWKGGNGDIRKAPRLTEQPSNLQREQVGPTHTQYTADHRGVFETEIPDVENPPLQISLPTNHAQLQKVIQVHQKFIKSSDLPCTQSMRETKMMLNFYNWPPKSFANYHYSLLKNMPTQDLMSVLKQDIIKSYELKNWDIFERYRNTLQKVKDHRLKLDEGAVLKDEDYRMMLWEAYHQKSEIMYNKFKAFCVERFPLCCTSERSRQKKTKRKKRIKLGRNQV